MTWVSVNPAQHVAQTLPQDLRTPTVSALARALLANAAEYHARFLDSRLARLRLCAYGFAKIKIEAALNDEFDPEARGIVIQNTSVFRDLTPLRDPGEGPTPILYDEPRNDGFIIYDSSDRACRQSFLVLVPDYITDLDTGKAAAIINRYKLAGKDYRIISVDNVGNELATLYTFIGYQTTI